MNVVPWRLRDTPWAGWLGAVPKVDIDSAGDDYHARMVAWLQQCPGERAPLDEEQHEQLRTWITEYRLGLTNARLARPSAGMDRILLPIIGFVGGTCGVAIIGSLGPFVAPGIIVAGGLSLISLAFAVPITVGNIGKGRRDDLINEIDTSLAEIGSKRYVAAQLPVPGVLLPAADLATDAANVQL